MRCDGAGPDSASPQPVMARASSLRTAISQRVASEPEREPDRPADRARRRLGATSCTVICILDPTRARARAWWRRRRPGAARCPLSTMLHLPPRFASLDRVLQGRRLCVHALAKRQGVRRLYGDFQGGYHTRGEQEQEEMRRLLLCPCASSALAFHACCLLCRACSSSPDCP